MKQIAQFAFSGAIGFFADTGALLLVHDWAGSYAGRFISFSCAVLTTWIINRSLTFRTQREGKPLHREFALYFLSMLGGGVVNISVYFCIVFFLSLSLRGLPVAVALGSMAGMMVNFWLSKRFVFTAQATKDI